MTSSFASDTTSSPTNADICFVPNKLQLAPAGFCIVFASRRSKRVLNNSRDILGQQVRHLPQWGGGRSAPYLTPGFELRRGGSQEKPTRIRKVNGTETTGRNKIIIVLNSSSLYKGFVFQGCSSVQFAAIYFLVSYTVLKLSIYHSVLCFLSNRKNFGIAIIVSIIR